MLCPSCGYTLQKLSVTTSSGGKFDVDHCGRCGGTWFDPYEINRIPYHEVVRLANLTVLPKTPLSDSSSFHRCPRCHKPLEHFSSESMPNGIRFLRCLKCHGIWATQKTLEIFKKQQEETIQEYKSEHIVFPALSVVFVPAITFMFILLATVATIANLNYQKTNQINAETLVQSLQIVPLSPSSVSITFASSGLYISSITLGTSVFDQTTFQIAATPSASHKIYLENLSSGATYTYHLTLMTIEGDKLTTSQQSFTMP